MSVNWKNMAIAAACTLENERLCERKEFLDEASLVRACAAFIQSTTQLLLAPEYNHPDLVGNRRLDLLGRSAPGKPATFVAEAKWVRPSGGARQWADEVAEDIMRLEKLTQETDTNTDRALIVGGIKRSLRAKFLDVTARAGNGNPRICVYSHVLQTYDREQRKFPYTQERICVRECDAGMRRFWKARGQKFNQSLPVSYQCALAGRHRSSRYQDAVEVRVWLIRRSRNRSTFNVNQVFSSV